MARGDVFEVSFPAPVPGAEGHEQIGRRPAIVVETDSGQMLSTVMVAPLTTNLNALKTSYTFEVAPSAENGLREQSVILVMQLRAIDRRRLLRRLGRLEAHHLARLDVEIKRLLGLS